MSSSTRSRPDPRAVRSTVPVLVVLAVLWLAAPGAAAVPTGPTEVPLSDVTVLPEADRQVSLVVNVAGGTQPVPPDSVSVSVAGLRQPTAVVPVMSDQLASGIVVDASQEGASELASWLSGAARFVLEEPAAARTAVVADTTPPPVLAELQQGPADVVRALSAVRPHGKRDTSDALTLAVHQLPATLAVPRVVILYTGAADAGGEASNDLAARLAKEHVLLVVVTTATDTRYWSTATRPTGGFLAPAGTAAAGHALDQVASTLRTRYLITFPTPAQLPTLAAVRVELPDVTMSTSVLVPAKDAGTRVDRGRGYAGSTWMKAILWAAAIGGALALLIWTALLLVGRTFRRM